MPYSLGIRYAKSLSGSPLGMVTLLKVLLSIISCGFLRVQWGNLHCVVVATIWQNKRTLGVILLNTCSGLFEETTNIDCLKPRRHKTLIFCM